MAMQERDMRCMSIFAIAMRHSVMQAVLDFKFKSLNFYITSSLVMSLNCRHFSVGSTDRLIKIMVFL